MNPIRDFGDVEKKAGGLLFYAKKYVPLIAQSKDNNGNCAGPQNLSAVVRLQEILEHQMFWKFIPSQGLKSCLLLRSFVSVPNLFKKLSERLFWSHLQLLF